MLQWVRNLLLVIVAVVLVTLICAIPLFTLYASYGKYGPAGLAIWYAVAVVLSFLFEVRILRNPAVGGVPRMIAGCLIAPFVVLIACAIACLPLYLVLQLF